MPPIRIRKSDATFSRYVRARDGKCMRCKKLGEPDKDGLPITGLQCSHYFGRAGNGTRHEPNNCIALCFGCHQIWGSNDREAYRNFMISWLGENGFKLLVIQNNTYKRKDEVMAYIRSKALLDDLLAQRVAHHKRITA